MKKETLELELENALEAYNNGSQEVKNFLINAYGKKHFLTDIKDRVTDYESACRELGLEPLTEADFGILHKNQRKRYFNRHVLTVVIEALNEDWKPDFQNHSEYKYYNYPYTDGKGGFAFDCDYYNRICDAGSDLYYKSRELAEYGQTILKQHYLDYSF